jgi:hypothetical protein
MSRMEKISGEDTARITIKGMKGLLIKRQKLTDKQRAEYEPAKICWDGIGR